MSSHGVLKIITLMQTNAHSLTTPLINSRVDNILVNTAQELNRFIVCWTHSYMVSHIWQSTGLFWGHKSTRI